MDARTFQRQRGNTVILATACIAMALWSTSCGGGGGSAVAPPSTPSFSASLTSITFANQPIGTTSPAQATILINLGNANLTFSSVQVTGPNAGDFTVTNDCGSSLAPSAQCTVSVTFTPSAAGVRTASVVFTDNASGSPQTLNLTGTGTSPGVGLSLSSLTFGSQLVGTSAAAQTVTLTNNGNGTLNFTSIAVTGANAADFPETSTCGSSLAALENCTISVTFTPAAAGSRTATVNISDNAAGSPQTVSLTGTGTSPTVTLTASSLTFITQTLGTTSPAQSVTLSNSGNAALNIASIALAGANPGDFTETTTCGASVAAGGSCTISVTFTPTSAASYSASVVITDNASSSPQMITLTGTGVGTAPVAGLSTNSLTFGSQSLGTTSGALTVILSNTGNQTLTTAIAVKGTNAGDFGETDNCGGSVAANGGSCTINVTFTPTLTSTENAAVTITDNAANSPQTVSLSGTGTASVVSLSASTLTFASQPVSTTSAPQAVTLTNTGNVSLSISTLALTGTNAGDFGETTTCPLSPNSVPAKSACTITVTFTPTAPGTRTATVTITDNAAGSPQTVILTGTGSGNAVNLTATSLIFGSQTLGTTSGVQPVTLSNTGNATLNITSLVVTGANAGDFAQTNTCGSSVLAGGNCTISVTFTPTAPGSRTASVTITDNAPGSPQTVSLTGTGSGPVVALSASNLSFSSQAVGSTSGTQTLTLNNTGNAPLTITSNPVTGTNAGDFSATSTCGSTVAPGGTCTFSVTFAPTASGTRTASLTITDNATNSPQTVNLSGTGTGPTASLSVASLTFNNVGTTSVPQTLTLSNTGNAALSISGIAFTGANAGDFGETTTCGSSLAVSSSCTITVTFTPAAAGSRTASLNITDNSNNVAGNQQSVSLTGTSTGPIVSLNPPSTLPFGSETEGTASATQSVTLTNTGNASLLITSISVTGANASDFSQTNSCGGLVGANGTCTIIVTFTPSGSGSRTAAISIVDNAPGSPQSETLTGTGLSGQISLSASSLTFASQNVGTTSTAQSVTLTNTGNTGFTLTGVSLTGANPGDFSLTSGCGSSLAQNATCTIIVQFTPTAPGTRTSSISIADSLASSPQTVVLTGTGSGAAVSFSAGTLTFTSQNLGTTSAAQSVTLTNTGNVSLTITSIGTTGANPSDFTVTNTCGSTVAVNGSCTMSVTFTPAAIGSLTAAVSIADNAHGSPQTVNLIGTGSAPVASVPTTPLTFSSQNLGTTSGPQTFTLQNTGNAPLAISSIAFTGANPGDFADTTTCAGSVAASSSCTISVTFTPTAAGSRTAFLNITDNSNNVAGSQQSVSLTGTGTGPVVSLSALTLPFGSQSLNFPSAPLGVTLTNTGNAPLSITSIAVTGANFGDFAQTNTCGTSVLANGTCTINVTFTPIASGSRTASITITDNATSSPQSVTLTGTGTASVATLSAATLNFGNQPVHTASSPQIITLTNTGNGSLTITSISVTGTNAADFGETTTCPLSPISVAANGGTCTITVTFTPSTSGSRTASVSIVDNAAGSPQAVSLIGTGTTPTVGLSATVLTFGTESVGSSSNAQTITLTNAGSAALSVTSIQVTDLTDFVQTNNCGSSVAANGSCTISVTFKPAAPGSLTATLNVTDNATNSPQTVSLTGIGTGPQATLTSPPPPSDLIFSSQGIDTASSAQSVTLFNSGNENLSFTGISFTGTNPLDFGQSNTCDGSLPPNGTCTVAVTFTPTPFASSGAYSTFARSASLVLTDNTNNAPGSTQTVTITGTASHDVILSWTASLTPGVSYDVYRGPSLGNETSTPQNSTPISGLTYVDTNVVAGASYCYYVTAITSGGIQSVPSNEACTPTPVPPP